MQSFANQQVKQIISPSGNTDNQLFQKEKPKQAAK